jgi:transcriptional regulator with XRE-family HTH domain
VIGRRAGHRPLTRSWLSKVENFRVTPSLPALGEIAKALGVKVSSLLEDLDKRPEFVLVKGGRRAAGLTGQRVEQHRLRVARP